MEDGHCQSASSSHFSILLQKPLCLLSHTVPCKQEHHSVEQKGLIAKSQIGKDLDKCEMRAFTLAEKEGEELLDRFDIMEYRSLETTDGRYVLRASLGGRDESFLASGSEVQFLTAANTLPSFGCTWQAHIYILEHCCLSKKFLACLYITLSWTSPEHHLEVVWKPCTPQLQAWK